MAHIAISQYNLINKVNSLLKYDWKSEENGLPIYCLECSWIKEYLEPKPDYNPTQGIGKYRGSTNVQWRSPEGYWIWDYQSNDWVPVVD